MPVEFCPRQIIFELPGSPGVLVTATENGSGGIDFIVDAEDGAKKSADLRALFFDFNEVKMAGLVVTDGSGLITETRIAPNALIDLGNGANLQGATKALFDVGIEWGSAGAGRDVISDPVEFTLSNTAGNLTLDDIAHERFGARTTSVGQKLIVVAPAAPDANDDSYTIFEDNSSGLNDPSKSPTNFVMSVLANDTDADGDALTITSIHEQPAFGTVSITGGGTTLTYTPSLDYAGQVTFEYCVSDGDGGQDHAQVTIDLTPVADIPLFNVTIAGTANVNEVLLTVTVDQNDIDSSEFMDSLVTSALPDGVTITPVSVDPAGQPDTIDQVFLLTLPLNQDSAFDLTITGTAEETGNADQQTADHVVPIVYEYNSTTVDAQFVASNQSIWSSGAEFVFDDERFIGIDTGYHNPELSASIFHAGLEYDLRLGLDSDLHFEGGDIDATANYDITVETNYNKTVDTLRLGTAALLQDAIFNTVGPEGSYVLDFVWSIFLHAYAGVDGIGDADLGTVDENGTYNLLDINSDSLAGTIDLPGGFSFNYDWPDVAANGSLPPNPGSGSDTSDNFVELNLDIDTLVANILGIPNIFDPDPVSILGIDFDLTFIDADLFGGLNLMQEFALFMGSLKGTLTFEDGSVQAFTLGDTIQLTNASEIDANTLDPGGPDGKVDFVFSLTPDADLTNDTSVNVNIGFHLELLSLYIDAGILGDTTLGPAFEDTWDADVANIPVYSDTFNLAFSSGQYAFMA